MNVAQFIEALAAYNPDLMVCLPDGGDVDYREVSTLEVRRILMIDEDEGSETSQECLVLDG